MQTFSPREGPPRGGILFKVLGYPAKGLNIIDRVGYFNNPQKRGKDTSKKDWLKGFPLIWGQLLFLRKRGLRGFPRWRVIGISREIGDPHILGEVLGIP